MLANKIITKEKFLTFLHNTFINKEDITNLMYIFYYVRDVEVIEEAMFLLYNEYLTVDEVLGCLNVNTSTDPSAIPGYTNTDYMTKTIKDNLITIIDSTGITFHEKNSVTQVLEDVSYKYVKEYLFRDYVSTLTYENYEGNKNYVEQLEIVYDSLEDYEKKFLMDELGISRDNMIRLVRTQENSEKISLALCERHEEITELSGKCLGILRDNECFKDVGSTITIAGESHIVQNGDYYYIKKSKNHTGINQFIPIYSEDLTQCIQAKPYQYLYIQGNIWNLLTFPSIVRISEILNITSPNVSKFDTNGNATIETNLDYYLNDYSENDPVKSKRECLISILNKISLGTIH